MLATDKKMSDKKMKRRELQPPHISVAHLFVWHIDFADLGIEIVESLTVDFGIFFDLVPGLRPWNALPPRLRPRL